MLTLFRGLIALLALLCLAAANSAFADTINLSGDSVAYGPGATPTGVVSLIGDRGFTFSGFAPSQAGVLAPATECLLCSPGTTISLHALQVDNDLPGQATLDGVFYPHVGSLVGPAHASIEFTGAVVAPPFGQSSTAILTTPVAFSGLFNVDRVGAPPSGNQMVALASATLTLQQTDCCGGPAWRYAGVRYDLEPVPVPEPGTLTLLLVGSAMAGLGLAWRSRSGT
jgi:PEP-CTERM motif-containing protein